MNDFLFRLAKPILHSMEPEKAHELTLSGLRSRRPPRAYRGEFENLKVNLFGLDFPNPLGMAAGFDKNAEVSSALLSLGFGFVEVGTVTPLAQKGNPVPRVFRLPDDGALINRLGFNNKGHGTAYDNLRRQTMSDGIVGVNIGANKQSEDKVADYVKGLEHFYDLASFYVVNISSPNTPGLRNLQSSKELSGLVQRLMKKREELHKEFGNKVPLLVKIAPDLELAELKEIAAIFLKEKVDGVIISNTTLSRDGVGDENAGEDGGLSGKPLFERSTRVLAQFYLLSKGRVPIIGVGGIHSAETAYKKIQAGASLLEFYTALVYEGPGLLGEILTGLDRLLRADGYKTLSQAVGSKATEISKEK